MSGFDDMDVMQNAAQDDIDEYHLVREFGNGRKRPMKIESKAALRAECEKATRMFYGEEVDPTAVERAAESKQESA